MNLLCDTCSIIMLLRIVPDLFKDPRFQCATIREVREEIYSKREFKTKYPWLEELRKRVSPMPTSDWRTDGLKTTLGAVRALSEAQVNTATGRRFHLSMVDKLVAAAVVAQDMRITTTDRNLEDFLMQQFTVRNEQPLKLVNDWIERGLIEWNDARQAVIDDWVALNERPQPPDEIRRFQRLTKRKYPRA